MKMPWRKLWVGTLEDQKIGFLIQRYGHEISTLWIMALTQANDDGLIATDPEILQYLTHIEAKRFDELIGIMEKHHLLERNQEEIRVVNWAKYQESSSAERTRQYRAKKEQKTCDTNVTNGDNAGDAKVTGELELELELEEEEEEEKEEEEEASFFTESRKPEIKGEKPEHFEIAYLWYKRYTQETSMLIAPDERDMKKALELWRRIRGDISTARRVIDIYFSRWRDLWWACSTESRKNTQAENKKAVFDFGAWCTRFPEILALEIDWAGLGPSPVSALAEANIERMVKKMEAMETS